MEAEVYLNYKRKLVEFLAKFVLVVEGGKHGWDEINLYWRLGSWKWCGACYESMTAFFEEQIIWIVTKLLE